jgi:aryl-alcohol dehydrogenase-like predicted oxidoreductase
MKYGNLPGVTKPVSRLVQGVGRARSLGEPAGFELLDSFFEKGCNVFDTARVYGASDRFLGSWIADRGIRDRVVILGKGAHHAGTRQRVTPQDIQEDLETSLREMGTDHIDLYVLHRDDTTQPVGPIVETLAAQAAAGKIGAYGGSNWSPERLGEANAYARDHGLPPFVLTNPNYSLAVQVEEPWDNCVCISGPAGAAARQIYREWQMPVFCWSSLAAGFLSGRITRENKDEMASQFNELVARCYYSDDNFERLDRARTLAEQRGATVPQIALAFLLAQGLDLYALVSCANAEELQANIDAFDLHLSPAEARWLDLETPTLA